MSSSFLIPSVLSGNFKFNDNVGIGIDASNPYLMVGPDAVDDTAYTVSVGETFTTNADDVYRGLSLIATRDRSADDTGSSTRGLAFSVVQNATGQNTGLIRGLSGSATSYATGTTGVEVTGVSCGASLSSTFDQTLALAQGVTASLTLSGDGGALTLGKALRGHTLYAADNLTTATKTVGGSFSLGVQDSSVDITLHYGIEVETPETVGSPTPTQIEGIHVSDQNLGTTAYGVYIEGATTYALFVDSGITRLDGYVEHGTTSGITASVTQTQGQQALTTTINEVSTVGNANDVVTLPAAVTGMIIYVFNNGANSMNVFPASGDNIDGAGADTAVAQAAGKNAMYVAHDATNWNKVES